MNDSMDVNTSEEDSDVLDTPPAPLGINRQLFPIDGISAATRTTSRRLFPPLNHDDDRGDQPVRNQPALYTQTSSVQSTNNLPVQQQGNPSSGTTRIRPDRNALIAGVPHPKRPHSSGRGRRIDLTHTQSMLANHSNLSTDTSHIPAAAAMAMHDNPSFIQQRSMDGVSLNESPSQKEQCVQPAPKQTRPAANNPSRKAHPSTQKQADAVTASSTGISNRRPVFNPAPDRALLTKDVRWQDEDKIQKMCCLNCGHEQTCRGYSYTGKHQCNNCKTWGFMKVPERILKVQRVPPRSLGTAAASYTDPHTTGYIEYEYHENGDLLH